MCSQNSINKFTCPSDNTRVEKKYIPPKLTNTSTFSALRPTNTNRSDTLLVENARKYVDHVWEDTTAHYNFLKKLGEPAANYYKNSAWCALTVSILAKEAGMDIGAEFRPTVSGFIQWGKNRGKYKSIPINKFTTANKKQEILKRKGAITKQIQSGNMKSGDFIIWKSDSAYTGKVISHIGIVESVDLDKNTVTVIEGNANEYTSDSRRRKKNPRDGLIRKVYTADELAKNGYSGFIDNAGLVK